MPLLPPEAIRALAATYLLLPQIADALHGRGVGATQPFPFFCDFEGDLADAVREGRRAEFAASRSFTIRSSATAFPTHSPRALSPRPSLTGAPSIPDRVAYYRALIAARREFVVPLLPEITRGGSADCYGAEAVKVRWQAGKRVLVLAANLSSRRVDFPKPDGRTIWSEGDTTSDLGPWSVRWSLA